MKHVLTILLLLTLLKSGAAVNFWTNAPSTGYVAGDTNILYGTFTNVLTITNSGAPGNPITFLWAANASFTKDCWPGGGAIQMDAKSNLVFDGGVNGLMQNTNNGFGLGFTNDLKMISGTNLRDVTIKNLTFTNIFQRFNSFSQGRDAGNGCYAIQMSGFNGLCIFHCTASDAAEMFDLEVLSGTNCFNFSMISNAVLNYNHGLIIGCPITDGFGLNQLELSHNTIDHSDAYDTTNSGSLQLHMDALYFNGAATFCKAFLNNVQIDHNYFDRHISKTNPVGTGATAVLSMYWTGISTNWKCYDNIVVEAESNRWVNTAFAAIGQNSLCAYNTQIGGVNAGNKCFNSSIDGAGYPGDFVLVTGNLSVNCAVGMNLSSFVLTNAANVVPMSGGGSNVLKALTNYFATQWASNNIYVNAQDANSPAYSFTLWNASLIDGESVISQPSLYPLTNGWNNYFGREYNTGGAFDCGCGWTIPNFNELHCDIGSASVASMNFNPGTFVPSTNNPAIFFNGPNLYAQGITNDYNGNARSPAGFWTVGALVAQAYVAPVTQYPIFQIR